jgi:hypothetical protein
MLSLDHLTVIAPTLADGVAHVHACLGVDVPFGTHHPDMGTYNHRLRLGEDVYLEIIAVDPEAPVPAGPRWFGLGDAAAVRADWAEGRRLRTWVARTTDMNATLAAHAHLLGGDFRLGQVARFSLLPDGRLPMNGLLPSVIDRGGGGSPAAGMADLGMRLVSFALEYPAPDEIAVAYASLAVRDAPRVRAGPRPRYVATIDTPDGPRTLT